MKKIVKTSWVLLFVYLFYSNHAFSQESLVFYEQAQKLTQQATKKREGVVIWTSLVDSTQKIWGNSKLLEKNFLPGSVFKLVTAQAAVENQLLPHYVCTGKDKIDSKVRTCWTYKGHGPLDFPQALAISCNLYFQNLGAKLGLENIFKVIQGYPSLKDNLDLQHLPLNFDLARFVIGDEVSYSLTPLQIDTFWNQYIQILQDHKYDAIYQGLRRTVNLGGTASKLRRIPLQILAKTGTGDALNENYKTNGWFLGAYPAQKPQYTILIFMQEAHGFEEPTRLAEKIFSKAYEFGLGEKTSPHPSPSTK